MSNNDKLVEVYKATNEIEAQVIKGLLESFGIASFLRSNAAPSVHMFTVDGMGQVKVMVLESVAAQARELIAASGEEPPDGPDT